MFLHEVEFLRKRAGVPSQGQVAVCCYGNGGRVSCSGEERGGAGGQKRKVFQEEGRGQAFENGERTKLSVKVRQKQQCPKAVMPEMAFQTLWVAIPFVGGQICWGRFLSQHLAGRTPPWCPVLPHPLQLKGLHPLQLKGLHPPLCTA